MPRNGSSSAEQLRIRASQGIVTAVGAPFALAGRMIEEAGFGAAYVSGAAFSAATLALPDVGLFTLTELVEHTRRLCAATDLPVIVDADTGFGTPVNVVRTVHELASAGAAAIQLEDQVLPKRCGHLSGKSLIEADEMCRKIRAAVSERSDGGPLLIARTDARGVNGLDDAMERAQRYVDAGADWIFPEALQTEDEFAAFADAVEAPLLANMTEFGKSPLLSQARLQELGFAAVIYPVTLLRVALGAMQRAMETLQQQGTQEPLLPDMQTRARLYELLRYADFEARDQEHFGGTS